MRALATVWTGSSPGMRFGLRLLTASLLLALGAWAQSASNWRVYSVGDGLTESLTTSVTVSPRRTVWVKHGEVDAVSVLDGYWIDHVPAPGERKYVVSQARNGRIVSLSDEGVLVLRGTRWVEYPIPAVAREQESNPFRAIRQPAFLPVERDRVLVLLRDRLIDYRTYRGELTTLRLAGDGSLGEFTDMTLSSTGGLWITGTKGVAHVPGSVRQVNAEEPWREHVVPEALGVWGLQHPFEDDDGGLTAVGTSRDEERRVLVHLDGEDWLTRALPGESLRYAWRGTQPGEFWGATINQVVRFEGERTEVVEVLPETTRIYDVAVAPGGVFWLATLQGLRRFAPLVWRTPRGCREVNEAVYAAASGPDDTLWFVSESGLMRGREDNWSLAKWPTGTDVSFGVADGCRVLPEGAVVIGVGGKLLLYHPEPGRFEWVRLPEGRRMAKVLSQFPDGALCVQTAAENAEPGDYRLEIFDGEAFREWAGAPPPCLLGKELFFLERSANGDLWLGGSAGPAVYRNGEWTRFGPREGYADEGALCLIETVEGLVWCAGLHHVSEFDGRQWRVVRSALDRARAMKRASDNSVWVATGSGLHRYFREAWGAVGVEEGLAGRAVYTVLEDSAGRIWAGTSRGVSRYLPESDLEEPKTLEISVVQSRVGTPESTLEIAVQGRDKWRHTLDQRLLYRHRMDNGAWSTFQPGRTITYHHLAAGVHRVEVQAMDRNWNIESTPALASFEVVVPWFRDRRVLLVAVMGGAMALGFAGLAINRHLQLRRSYARVERIVEERTDELRRANEALAQGQKMTALGTLASGIAHDFNNVLSIIKGSAQIIESHLNDRNRILTRTGRIRTAVDQGTGIVKAMLGFGRVSDHKAGPCEVGEIVEETVRLLSAGFRRAVRIRLHETPGLPAVHGVRDLVQQMVLNLILNAADAMNGAGEIGIRTGIAPRLPAEMALAPAPSQVHVFVSVTDQGSGISEENRPRIFEPFFTTKAFSTRRGTGLGLYMVYESAREMGHGLSVQSEPGHGSTFTIFFPLDLKG